MNMQVWSFLDAVAIGGCFLALAGCIVLGMIAIDRAATKAAETRRSAEGRLQ